MSGKQDTMEANLFLRRKNDPHKQKTNGEQKSVLLRDPILMISTLRLFANNGFSLSSSSNDLYRSATTGHHRYALCFEILFDGQGWQTILRCKTLHPCRRADNFKPVVQQFITAERISDNNGCARCAYSLFSISSSLVCFNTSALLIPGPSLRFLNKLVVIFIVASESTGISFGTTTAHVDAGLIAFRLLHRLPSSPAFR